MCKRVWNLKFAGVLVACALGAVALRVAWATPGLGATRTIITGPVLLEDVDLKSESDVNEAEIQLKGFTDVYVANYRIAPGGHTGWHSHPGVTIASVKSGTITLYSADDPTTPHVYPAGTGFVETEGHAHIGVNGGSTDVEVIAIQIVPIGAPLRIDEPAPESGD